MRLKKRYILLEIVHKYIVLWEVKDYFEYKTSSGSSLGYSKSVSDDALTFVKRKQNIL